MNGHIECTCRTASSCQIDHTGAQDRSDILRRALIRCTRVRLDAVASEDMAPVAEADPDDATAIRLALHKLVDLFVRQLHGERFAALPMTQQNDAYAERLWRDLATEYGIEPVQVIAAHFPLPPPSAAQQAQEARQGAADGFSSDLEHAA